MRRGRLWGLHGAAGWRSRLRVSGGNGTGGGMRSYYGGRAGGSNVFRRVGGREIATSVSRPWRGAVRGLQSGNARSGDGLAGEKPCAARERGDGRDWRRALSLYGISEDHRGDS